MKPRRSALLFASFALAAVGTALVAACAGDDDPEVGESFEAGTGDGRAREDGAVDVEDAAPDARVADAGSDARDAAKRDANGPGAADADCAFNADCQSALRCECTEASGCSCQPGVRGKGQNGVDVCDAGAFGADCESAVCVEGPNGVYYCSDQCQTAQDCTGTLPKCTNVSFVGQICVREPPK